MKTKYFFVLLLIVTLISTTGCIVARRNEANTLPVISAYKLHDVKTAYISDIYEDKIIYELTSEDISDITTSFNEAFDTITEPEDWDAWSPGVVLTIHVSEKELVNIYTFGETEQFLVSYIMALPEGDTYQITDYNLESFKLRKVYDTIAEKFRGN